MAVDHSSERWRDQNDPFGEDFYLVPHAEETWARIERVAEDNKDALRHFVELAIWGALDNPDLLKVLLSLLWLWDDIDPIWLAEATFMKRQRRARSCGLAARHDLQLPRLRGRTEAH